MNKRNSFLAAVFAALTVALAGCGNATGPESNSFTMSATTTPARVESVSSPQVLSYSAITMVNLSATPVYLGGPTGRATAVCSDATQCGGTSFTQKGGNVWIESSSGTVANIQIQPVGR